MSENNNETEQQGLMTLLEHLFELKDHLIRIAIALVVTVIFLFLGSFRAMLVPAVTVPVSLIATFLVLWMLGFSINTLSLLGLVLAIGTVVDDGPGRNVRPFRRRDPAGRSVSLSE